MSIKSIKYEILTILSMVLVFHVSFAQNEATGKVESQRSWPVECKKIEIISSVDHVLQPAYFFRAKSERPRPLVVRLHAWSADYSKVDDVAQLCIDNDYNYIHPNFRGSNDRPEACGSSLVIQDIDDAIDYAIAHANVDTTSIHVVGGSGGGYATLLCYMKIKHRVKTFTAWASITNLVDYYYECAGRREKYEKYMHDLEKATSGLPENGFVPYFNKAEAVKRSPVFMDTPVYQRENSKLFIFAGIHDGGLSGDVPFTHSLKMFNKIVSDFDYSDQKVLFSTEEMLHLMDWQTTGAPVFNDHLSVLVKRQYLDKVQINLFEGGHEMIMDRVLDGVKGQNILVIGDSNGTIDEGWVNQLKEERFPDFIYNTSISGNTIGFDNLGEKKLNTLRQVDRYMDDAEKALNGIDKILIMLGTNDCKTIFKDSLKIVPTNMKTLLQKIKAHRAYQKYQPEIFVISPPPYASDDQLAEKYKGGAQRIAWLYPQIRKVAEDEGVHFIDIYAKILPMWENVTTDGIHLTSPGQKIIADMISKSAWK
jgi:lysophospholipase L1-like esterase/pimeloyl-ACP methyl ester carboxylesterase